MLLFSILIASNIITKTIIRTYSEMVSSFICHKDLSRRFSLMFGNPCPGKLVFEIMLSHHCSPLYYTMPLAFSHQRQKSLGH